MTLSLSRGMQMGSSEKNIMDPTCHVPTVQAAVVAAGVMIWGNVFLAVDLLMLVSLFLKIPKVLKIA